MEELNVALPITLGGSGDYLLQPIIGWETSSASQSVRLTASVQSGSNPQTSPGRAATNVVLLMDSQVAKQLYEKLDALGRSMGWLP
jgi:hypothetical protein